MDVGRKAFDSINFKSSSKYDDNIVQYNTAIVFLLIGIKLKST